MRKAEKELLDKYHELEGKRDKLLNGCKEYDEQINKLNEKIAKLREELASCKTQIDIYKKLLYGGIKDQTNCDLVIDGNYLRLPRQIVTLNLENLKQ